MSYNQVWASPFHVNHNLVSYIFLIMHFVSLLSDHESALGDKLERSHEASNSLSKC